MGCIWVHELRRARNMQQKSWYKCTVVNFHFNNIFAQLSSTYSEFQQLVGAWIIVCSTCLPYQLKSITLLPLSRAFDIQYAIVSSTGKYTISSYLKAAHATRIQYSSVEQAKCVYIISPFFRVNINLMEINSMIYRLYWNLLYAV